MTVNTRKVNYYKSEHMAAEKHRARFNNCSMRTVEFTMDGVTYIRESYTKRDGSQGYRPWKSQEATR